ncbi:SDR family NAD(P)-dependent oxidoreductase [Lactococcus cremoris]|uniref:SDR family NAD(P)-dependent oxidoreductase n=1 Tax=Lactococcus lactis subsp. cremoris TaxID=1359 RepID=UPI000A739CC3
MAKNIVITGATGDIAKEIVSLLSKTNDHLILVSRSRTALEKLYGQLANVTLLTNDELLTAEQSYDVDILINNAGFGIFKDFTELTDSEITEQFVINTLMPIQLTRQLKPRLQLINIASIAGKLPTRKSSIYAASKAALITFSDALRMENPQLIVTTVNTGPVRTKFHKDNGDYLNKVGKSAISAAKVADKIVNNLGKRKRELNLPWTLSTAAKLRSLFPSLVDFFINKIF